MSEFEVKLKAAGLSKRGLAKVLGICPQTVSNWGDDPKVYAVRYLDLLIQSKVYTERLETLNKAGWTYRQQLPDPGPQK